ncbi:hypothetical protein EJ02DRAFT_340412 [Clathrospora elynae]|uniref:RING-type domain-containing protein n=1 Tax=Clathrospora elynae TaxID=706981 RepID=A0A6A5SVK3_9PLEO|nr:hypothetical protein EJ02DRAFT_340412 [Clathrospora elynae]
MANITETEPLTATKSSTIVVAIIVPSVLIIMFLALIIICFIMPYLGREEAVKKEERLKTRQDELEHYIKLQHFYDWLESQKEKNPGSLRTSDSLCAICLDEFADDAQVRGLRCSHAFHSHCLDEWFTRYNEYCPLCHRPIIPGSRAARRRARERTDPIPVVLMV